jgi:hypothetical protein
MKFKTAKILLLCAFILGAILTVCISAPAWLFMIFFLSSIGLGNYMGSTSEKRRWNKGVCKKTGKPWEYESSGELGDGSQMHCFASKDDRDSYYFSTQYLTLDIILRQYKGNKQIH